MGWETAWKPPRGQDSKVNLENRSETQLRNSRIY